MGEIRYRDYKCDDGSVQQLLCMPLTSTCPLCGEQFERLRVREDSCPLWMHVVKRHSVQMHNVPSFLCVCGELFTGDRIRALGTYSDLSCTPVFEWIYMHVAFLDDDEIKSHIMQRAMGVEYIAADPCKQRLMSGLNRDKRGEA